MHKSEALRSIIVCVDSYEDGVPKGSFCNACYEETAAFQSLTQFLVSMEHMLNVTRFPQAFELLRGIGPPKAVLSNAQSELRIMCGTLATFTVKILFRRNASWQGSVRWIEGGREEGFRSVLELIFLMDSVLTHRTMERGCIEALSEDGEQAANQ